MTTGIILGITFVVIPAIFILHSFYLYVTTIPLIDKHIKQKLRIARLYSTYFLSLPTNDYYRPFLLSLPTNDYYRPYLLSLPTNAYYRPYLLLLLVNAYYCPCLLSLSANASYRPYLLSLPANAYYRLPYHCAHSITSFQYTIYLIFPIIFVPYSLLLSTFCHTTAPFDHTRVNTPDN